jgi:hypothetical protein
MGDPGRRYSEEEFALILEWASTLQEEADGAATQLPERAEGGLTADGLSLQAVRDIAEEVGLHSRFIDQAAALLLPALPEEDPGLLGGVMTYLVEDDFACTLTRAQRAKLLDVIRAALRNQGVVRDVMGSVEWTSVGQSNRTTVTVDTHHEGVSVRVFTDLSGVAAMTGVVTIVSLLVVAGIIVDSMQPTFLAALAIFGIAGTAGVGLTRTIWSATRKFFRRRTERLRGEIALYLSR